MFLAKAAHINIGVRIWSMCDKTLSMLCLLSICHLTLNNYNFTFFFNIYLFLKLAFNDRQEIKAIKMSDVGINHRTCLPHNRAVTPP